MAKTCPCLPMGAKPNRLAHMGILAHMGTAKRLQRVLVPFGRKGTKKGANLNHWPPSRMLAPFGRMQNRS